MIDLEERRIIVPTHPQIVWATSISRRMSREIGIPNETSLSRTRRSNSASMVSSVADNTNSLFTIRICHT